MRALFAGFFMAGICAVGAALATDAAPDLTPREILDRVDDMYRGESSHGQIGMRVVTEHWTREMELEFWTKGKENSLIRILAPRKEKGTATLRAAHNIWNYLPRVNQIIKIPSSMMGVSWMGSHFTNDDLVKQSRMTDDFDFRETFTGERDGVGVVEITCLPKAGAAVVWGRVVVTVRRDGWIPLSIVYFDEDGKTARTLTFGEFRNAGDRVVPALARMVPADKPGEATELRYKDVSFNVPLPEDMFSLRRLQQ